MNTALKSHSFLLIALALISFPSYAYMGPGAGITAIGCLIALLAGVWYTFKGFLWLPLKRLLKKNKNTEQTQTHTPSQGQAQVQTAIINEESIAQPNQANEIK
jgi:hypothetical protein